jgi:hypothetical protein
LASHAPPTPHCVDSVHVNAPPPNGEHAAAAVETAMVAATRRQLITPTL